MIQLIVFLVVAYVVCMAFVAVVEHIVELITRKR
jgi:hypothetical protein